MSHAPTFGSLMAARDDGGAPPAVLIPTVGSAAPAAPSPAKRRASQQPGGTGGADNGASAAGPTKSPRLDAMVANFNARGEHVLEQASPRGGGGGSGSSSTGLTPMLRSVDLLAAGAPGQQRLSPLSLAGNGNSSRGSSRGSSRSSSNCNSPRRAGGPAPAPVLLSHGRLDSDSGSCSDLHAMVAEMSGGQRRGSGGGGAAGGEEGEEEGSEGFTLADPMDHDDDDDAVGRGSASNAAARPSAFASFLRSPDTSEPASPLPLMPSDDNGGSDGGSSGGGGGAPCEERDESAASNWQRLGSAAAAGAARRAGDGGAASSPVEGDDLASRLLHEQGRRQLRDCSPLAASRPYGGVTPTGSQEGSPDQSPARPLSSDDVD